MHTANLHSKPPPLHPPPHPPHPASARLTPLRLPLWTSAWNDRGPCPLAHEGTPAASPPPTPPHLEGALRLAPTPSPRLPLAHQQLPTRDIPHQSPAMDHFPEDQQRQQAGGPTTAPNGRPPWTPTLEPLERAAVLWGVPVRTLSKLGWLPQATSTSDSQQHTDNDGQPSNTIFGNTTAANFSLSSASLSGSFQPATSPHVTFVHGYSHSYSYLTSAISRVALAD